MSREHYLKGQEWAKSQERLRIQSIAWVVLPYIARIQSLNTLIFKFLILPLFPKCPLEKMELCLISAALSTGFHLKDRDFYMELFLKEKKKRIIERVIVKL